MPAAFWMLLWLAGSFAQPIPGRYVVVPRGIAGQIRVIAADSRTAAQRSAGPGSEAVIFQDRVVQAQAPLCVHADTLQRQGVQFLSWANGTRPLRWPGCLARGAPPPTWLGVPCNNGTGVLYTEVRASGPCRLVRDTRRPGWTTRWFGRGCGEAPLGMPNLPTSLCSPIRIPLAIGEQVPLGVARIEGFAGGRVVNATAAAPAVVVAVVDSGIDASHPDLHVVGGLSWSAGSESAVNDTYGHGTHVAGIIGAANNGNGIVGVAPGIPLFSLKVLGPTGRGSLSSVLQAVEWATTSSEAKAVGIRVINLSLAAFLDPASSDYPEVRAAVCGVFERASEAGLVAVAAAGNFATSLKGYLPADCPQGVLAATAFDAGSGRPAVFSNFAEAAEGRRQLLTAPGVRVLSTMPGAGYVELSGTSMASPHVAGAAALCIVTGACSDPQRTGGVLVAAALSKAQADPSYGLQAGSEVDGRSYGPVVWAGN